MTLSRTIDQAAVRSCGKGAHQDSTARDRRGTLHRAVGVLITALRRPKEPRGGRQDPLKFASVAPEFGPRQLGPGAIVSHGGIDYVVRGSVTDVR